MFNIVRRYNNATRTGFGNVFATKLTRVCKCGKIFEIRGALPNIVSKIIPRQEEGSVL
jgi:hypothetical protein